MNARIIDHVPEYMEIIDVQIDPQDQGAELPRMGQEIVKNLVVAGFDPETQPEPLGWLEIGQWPVGTALAVEDKELVKFAAVPPELMEMVEEAELKRRTKGGMEVVEESPVNGLVVKSHASLKMRPVVQVVHGVGLSHFVRFAEQARGTNERLRFVEVLFDIRPEVKSSPGYENTMQVLHERLCHDTTLVMALLPPGIGEVDVHCVNAVIGEPFAEDP